MGSENENISIKLRMRNIALLALLVSLLASCASSTTTVSNGSDLSRYKYVVFGTEETGDDELADLTLLMENALSERLSPVSRKTALSLITSGQKVLTPNIRVKSEKWDGGSTYISLILYDFDTGQKIAVIKSSGIGLTIPHDQELAFKAILKEIDKAFPSKNNIGRN